MPTTETKNRPAHAETPTSASQPVMPPVSPETIAVPTRIDLAETMLYVGGHGVGMPILEELWNTRDSVPSIYPAGPYTVTFARDTTPEGEERELVNVYVGKEGYYDQLCAILYPDPNDPHSPPRIEFEVAEVQLPKKE